MESAFIPANQALSQPILPSQKSPYFHAINEDRLTLQDRSWLPAPPPANFSLQPRLSRSSLAIASPTSSMPPSLRPVYRPYHLDHQPHPYFAQGPSAMGYIPQQPRRYVRHQGLQEPIVPLRKEFCPMQEFEQNRPASVPSHFIQPSPTMSEHSAHPMPQRPISVAHMNTQNLIDTNYSNGGLIPEKRAELWLSSSIQPSRNDSDSEIPPRRSLPFPAIIRTEAQEVSLGTHSETVKLKSPSPTVASINAQEADQQTSKTELPSRQKAGRKRVSRARTKKSIKPVNQPSSPKAVSNEAQEENQSTAKEAKPPRKTRERKKRPAVQSELSNERKIPKRKRQPKHPGDDLTNSTRASKRPVIGPLDQFSDSNRNQLAADGQNQSPSELDGELPQEPQHEQKSREVSRERNSRTGLSLATETVDMSANPQKVVEMPQSCPSEFTRDMDVENFSVASNAHLVSTTPRLSSHCDQISEHEVLQQIPSKATTVRDMPYVDSAAVIPCRVGQRSASQATTVSIASTNSPIAAAGDTKSNHPTDSVTMVDETVILERDISNIVDFRLERGGHDMLETMYAEILIKMTVRDEKLFEGVARTLQSSSREVVA
ncbi:hypothetical protein GGS21DRAFT_135755 [Xylaria nigripes]|nr:hypothetical protein GGS21DRAFT_135755 [Xylaria nigripes]